MTETLSNLASSFLLNAPWSATLTDAMRQEIQTRLRRGRITELALIEHAVRMPTVILTRQITSKITCDSSGFPIGREGVYSFDDAALAGIRFPHDANSKWNCGKIGRGLLWVFEDYGRAHQWGQVSDSREFSTQEPMIRRCENVGCANPYDRERSHGDAGSYRRMCIPDAYQGRSSLIRME